MADTRFNETVASLFKGMDAFISAKTVVGESVKYDDGTIIVPFVDVSFGVGAGAMSGKKDGAAGGMGGKISPNSVLVIQDGKARLVSVKSSHDTVSKLVDLVPDVIDKFKKPGKESAKEAEMDRKGREFIDGMEE